MPPKSTGSKPFLRIAPLVAGGTLIVIGLISSDALRVVLRDGGLSFGIVISATGLGLWVVRGLGLEQSEPRWQFLLAVGLGLGTLALLMLGLGMLGLLNRGLWITLLLMFVVMGALRLRKLLTRRKEPRINKLHIPYGWYGHLARTDTGGTPVPPQDNRPVYSCARPKPEPIRHAGTLPVGSRLNETSENRVRFAHDMPAKRLSVHPTYSETPRHRSSHGDKTDIPSRDSCANGRAMSHWLYWLWLVAIGFAALSLLGGAMPPGILWPAEGNGYDVLEYHFGAPRQYLDAGRITYLPDNIYSNFPFNIEMLYLLSMILHGDPIRAVYTAKLLNVVLAALAVGAVWLAGRAFGRQCGLITGLLTASCPFLVYLSGVAYVENGMIFFAALSLAAFLRAFRDPLRSGRWMLASGLLAGMACGCKYTAAPAVALPLLLAAGAVPMLSRWPVRPGRLIFLFAGGCLLTLSPWLIKNVVATGNPVFPLGYNAIGASAGIWNDDGAARWHLGHLPAPEDRPPVKRLLRLWQEVIGSRLFGPVIALGLFAGCLLGFYVPCFRRYLHAPQAENGPPGSKSREDPSDDGPLWIAGWMACGFMIVIGLITWLGFTHLVGRFAIVLIVPCSVLAGRLGSLFRSRAIQRIAIAILITVLGCNLLVSWRLFTNPETPYLRFNLFGKTELFTQGLLPGTEHIPRVNNIAASLRRLGNGSKILVVGEARRFYLPPQAECCVVFNRNPLAQAAKQHSAEQLLDWLRDHRYAYVYVDWSEMWRLRHSRYGFWQSITHALFDRLKQVGLRRVEDFHWEQNGSIHATLYAVPPMNSVPIPPTH